MTLSGRVFITLVLLAGAGVAGRLALTEGRGVTHAPTAPDRGKPAPLRPDWLGAWQELGRLPFAAGAEGTTVDVATRSDTLYVLQPHSWWRIAGGRVVGPFGGPGAGPSALGRATAIAVFGDAVFILDAGRREVSRWRASGELTSRLPLRVAGAPASFLPEGLAVDSAGGFTISAVVYDTGRGRGRFGFWRLLRYTASGAFAATLYDQGQEEPETSPIAGPAFAMRPDGQLLVAGAFTYRLSWRDRNGRMLRAVQRRDPPLWRFPSAARTRYEGVLSRIPPGERKRWELPDHLPPVRRIAWLEGDRILVLLNAGPEALTAEVVAPDGVPLARFDDAIWAAPVFPTSHGLIRVREEPDALVIERAPL